MYGHQSATHGYTVRLSGANIKKNLILTPFCYLTYTFTQLHAAPVCAVNIY